MSQADPAAHAKDFSRRDVLSVAVAAGIGSALLPITGCETDKHVSAEAASPTAAPLTRAPADRSGTVEVALNINGEATTLQLEPRVTLLDALREYAGLTGTKKGCDHGQCGACTVLIDGNRRNACLTLAIMHEGAKITTIEGLARGDQLHPVQAAFIEHDALQCGYCTPGQICSAMGLISEHKAMGTGALTDEQIREGMAGNICRCGAYVGIVAAVKQAAGAVLGQAANG